ncbi:MAG: S26 family signal peptidase [Phycisphaerales bacterium]|nr:S26 family signal peptidase [Phycisphaerales bacterium]
MSLLIAFTIALIFRGIVLEPFQIPTGSMAPTLLGAHVRMYDKETGYTWPMSPSKFIDTGMQMATTDQPVTEAREPNTNRLLPSFNTVSSSGDRIFVLKYMYPFGAPERWDVVVFRNPTSPQEYYIKRLVGLENEELALVDGDVFTRPFKSDRNESPEECWQSKEWRIARKPLRAQNAVWQLLFDSTYTPLNPARDGRKWFSSPWLATTAGWKGQDTPVYTYEGSGATSLKWDTKNRPITDLNHYNDTPQLNYAGRQSRPVFPCSDVKVTFGYRPASNPANGPASGPVGSTIRVNGHEFRARVEPDGGATVSMRAVGEEAWVTLATAAAKTPLSADSVTNIDFRHVDQTVQLLVNDKLVCEGRYDWTPAQRAEYSTGKPLAAVLSLMVLPPPLSLPSMYTSPEVSIDLPGACELHRVGLARDLFYQPVSHMIPPRAGGPARGTHPKSIQVQQANEFFMMGDNSPASLDGRLWADSDPWVQTLIDPADGIVPRDLIVGKAFCVFFPAMAKQWGRVPVPDLGQLRWIW